jgi:tripartite-type tricarboxylate transporter receptor subunit TctC
MGGLSGPPGLDQEVVTVVSRTVQKVLKESELAAALRKIEAEPAYLGPAEWKAFISAHAEKVKKLLGPQK